MTTMDTTVEGLLQPGRPPLVLTTREPAELAGALSGLLVERADLVVAEIDGRAALTSTGTVGELARALDLPDWMSLSWRGLDDGLTGLAGSAVVVLVHHGQLLLTDEQPVSISNLDEVLRRAGEPPPSVPARPVTLVLAVPAADLPATRRRWETAGAAVRLLA